MAMLPIVTSHGERVFGERAAISGAGLETDQLHPAAGALSTRPGRSRRVKRLATPAVGSSSRDPTAHPPY
jgi:hypothetical protein